MASCCKQRGRKRTPIGFCPALSQSQARTLIQLGRKERRAASQSKDSNLGVRSHHNLQQSAFATFLFIKCIIVTITKISMIGCCGSDWLSNHTLS